MILWRGVPVDGLKKCSSLENVEYVGIVSGKNLSKENDVRWKRRGSKFTKSVLITPEGYLLGENDYKNQSRTDLSECSLKFVEPFPAYRGVFLTDAKPYDSKDGDVSVILPWLDLNRYDETTIPWPNNKSGSKYVILVRRNDIHYEVVSGNFSRPPPRLRDFFPVPKKKTLTWNGVVASAPSRKEYAEEYGYVAYVSRARFESNDAFPVVWTKTNDERSESGILLTPDERVVGRKRVVDSDVPCTFSFDSEWECTIVQEFDRTEKMIRAYESRSNDSSSIELMPFEELDKDQFLIWFDQLVALPSHKNKIRLALWLLNAVPDESLTEHKDSIYDVFEKATKAGLAGYEF